MANHKQKLELTWIGKDVRPRLEPRILLEDRKGRITPSGNGSLLRSKPNSNSGLL